MVAALTACGDGAPDKPPDADPFCHVDCFSWTICEGSTVEHVEGRPIPCDQWEGSCPEPEVIHMCDRECAEYDIGPFANPEDLCFQCPGAFVPDPIAPSAESVDTTLVPSMIVASAEFSGSDGGTHQLSIRLPDDAPIGTNLDLATSGVGVTLLFDGASTPGDEQMYLASFAGTINFERACSVGVAATLTAATMLETYEGVGSAPVPDGCTLTVSTAIEIGDACDVGADAGPLDGG